MLLAQLWCGQQLGWPEPSQKHDFLSFAEQLQTLTHNDCNNRMNRNYQPALFAMLLRLITTENAV